MGAPIPHDHDPRPLEGEVIELAGRSRLRSVGPAPVGPTPEDHALLDQRTLVELEQQAGCLGGAGGTTFGGVLLRGLRRHR